MVKRRDLNNHHLSHALATSFCVAGVVVLFVVAGKNFVSGVVPVSRSPILRPVVTSVPRPTLVCPKVAACLGSCTLVPATKNSCAYCNCNNTQQ